MENQRRDHDEIDVFDLFRYIGKGFNKIGNIFLRFFNFLIRNIIILVILVVVGIVAGYFVDKATPEKHKTGAIVAATFESAEYLYKTIEEMNVKIEEQDSLFLKSIGLSAENPGVFSLEVEPLATIKEVDNDQKNYFEILLENELIKDDQLLMIINKSYDKHKITLIHGEDIDGRKILRIILEKVRNNEYYQKLTQLMYESLERQIQSNKFLVAQIDSLIKNYSTGSPTKTSGNVVFSETFLDLGKLLSSRMEMLEETRELQRERVTNSSFIQIVNMGIPQKLEEVPLSERYIIFFPALLLGVFFLIHILRWVYSKAKKLKESEK